MTKTVEIVKVGIADLKIASAPKILRTAGLGSCVGVVVYDLPVKVAGMAHIMLPNSSLTKNKQFNHLKYADTAILELLTQLKKAGARKYKWKAKIAGGSEMFQYTTASEVMRIGPRNVQAVLRQLNKHQIPVVAKDVGGNHGRTIEFDPHKGLLKIKAFHKGEKDI